ncbi:MAG: hypothetical protein ACI9P7_002440, partial [Candidatus Azotimanducaceae bacterium]
SLRCWNCHESLDDVPRPISRHASCSVCFEMLHCCLMCIHYEAVQRPYCDEDLADPPLVKETANFCEYFKPANRFGVVDDKVTAATSKLNELFDAQASDVADEISVDSGRKKSGDAEDKLNRLFDD